MEKEKLDIVIFCPENSRHGEVAEAIAGAGAHLVTEKPMAASLPEALRMARAVGAAGVELMVNWPTTWSPAVRAAKALLEQGAIGPVWELKWRNGASMGPLAYGTGPDEVTDAEKGAEWWHQAAAGGGALLDYCCYGACLSRWLLDQKAVAASSLKANVASPYGDAEDNAVIVVRFERAMAILEGTWTTWNTGLPVGPVIYGTRGTLVVDHAVDPRTGKDAPAVKVYTTRAYHGEPDRIVFGDPLPAGRATLAEEFVHHLETGDPLHPTLQLAHNLEAMAILDAGIRSAASGRQELVGDASLDDRLTGTGRRGLQCDPGAPLPHVHRAPAIFPPHVQREGAVRFDGESPLSRWVRGLRDERGDVPAEPEARTSAALT